MPIHDWTRVSAGSFHTFHGAWITELTRALNNGVLPDPYYAESEQTAGQTGPDVLALDMDSNWTVEGRVSSLKDAGATAVADAPPDVSITQIASEEELYAAKRNLLAIRHSSGDELVAFIELVSSGNKGSRRALDQFLDKAYSVIKQGVHLLVIDLYPPGQFDLQGIHGAIWNEIDGSSQFALPDNRNRTLASYCAALQPEAYVEPLALGVSIPDMPLFLDPHWYVNVPLESTYNAAFGAIPARRRRELTEPE